MKKHIFYLFLIIAIPIISFAQKNNYDTTAAYLKTKKIPAFKLLQHCSTLNDSTWLTNDSLPKNKNIVFVYFSPECGHCEYETGEIVKHIKDLENGFFVFVSYHEVDKIKAFYERYNLSRFGNIRMARDTNYFLPAFFRVEFTPFIAIYDSKGNFKQAFRQSPDTKELIQLVQ